MRIISGKYKGRNIKGYDIVGTRPTMNRVKESIFSMIQSYLNNSTVLDLFSGSGNYAIEALSNGANYAYVNDLNKECVKVINENIKALNIDNIMVTNFDYHKALNYYCDHNIKFDIIFLDPPYEMDCLNNILNELIKKNLLNKNALIIMEFTNDNIDNYPNLLLFKERHFGEKIVKILKKE